ncbi:hypothetical protein BDZ85DRAFT_247337 [Elsinoe ampelina]|uniref:Uncharacterized protein n=1 Tax=Elsinoe ampelina TaxID=302913 RepID=A0A6A6GMI8_9PEZI|nr:hypothetical protein BDZ85DRAFT_247337 [Elsinoe ampelina]
MSRKSRRYSACTAPPQFSINSYQLHGKPFLSGSAFTNIMSTFLLPCDLPGHNSWNDDSVKAALEQPGVLTKPFVMKFWGLRNQRAHEHFVDTIWRHLKRADVFEEGGSRCLVKQGPRLSARKMFEDHFLAEYPVMMMREARDRPSWFQRHLTSTGSLRIDMRAKTPDLDCAFQKVLPHARKYATSYAKKRRRRSLSDAEYREANVERSPISERTRSARRTARRSLPYQRTEEDAETARLRRDPVVSGALPADTPARGRSPTAIDGRDRSRDRSAHSTNTLRQGSSSTGHTTTETPRPLVVDTDTFIEVFKIKVSGSTLHFEMLTYIARAEILKDGRETMAAMWACTPYAPGQRHVAFFDTSKHRKARSIKSDRELTIGLNRLYSTLARLESGASPKLFVSRSEDLFDLVPEDLRAPEAHIAREEQVAIGSRVSLQQGTGGRTSISSLLTAARDVLGSGPRYGTSEAPIARPEWLPGRPSYAATTCLRRLVSAEASCHSCLVCLPYARPENSRHTELDVMVRTIAVAGAAGC